MALKCGENVYSLYTQYRSKEIKDKSNFSCVGVMELDNFEWRMSLMKEIHILIVGRMYRQIRIIGTTIAKLKQASGLDYRFLCFCVGFLVCYVSSSTKIVPCSMRLRNNGVQYHLMRMQSLCPDVCVFEQYTYSITYKPQFGTAHFLLCPLQGWKLYRKQ